MLAKLLACVALLVFGNCYAYTNSAQTPRIIGGRNARQGELPYQLSFQQNGTGHYCGATLIEIDGIQLGVTAGHCLADPDMIYTSYTLVAGELNLTEVSGIEQTKHVTKIVPHPNFTNLVYNDIALVFIESNFTLNENVKPVPLPVQDQVTTVGNLTVSGWGRIVYEHVYPDTLQVVELPVFNHTACEQVYDNFFFLVKDCMICAGDDSTRHVCTGDSGGPAVSDAGYFAGIVSWGWTLGECGKPNHPSVFAEVADYIDWIHDTVSQFKKARDL